LPGRVYGGRYLSSDWIQLEDERDPDGTRQARYISHLGWG
jgi:hypothetical protein